MTFPAKFITTLFIFVLPSIGLAQFDKEQQLLGEEYLLRVLSELSERHGIKFYFKSSDLQEASSIRLPPLESRTLSESISVVSLGASVIIYPITEVEYLVVPDQKNTRAYKNEVLEAAKDGAVLSDVSSRRLKESSRLELQNSTYDRFLIKGEPFYRALDNLGKEFKLNVYYHPDDVPYYTSYLKLDPSSIFNAFRFVSIGTDLLLVKYSSDTYVVAPTDKQTRAYAEDVVSGWETGRYRSPDDSSKELLQLAVGKRGLGESPIQFRGNVTDKNTAEVIIGAAIYNSLSGEGAVTDIDGNFQLPLSLGTHVLELRMLGYETQPLEVNILGRQKDIIKLTLEPQAIGFDEVVVTATSQQEIVESATGSIRRISLKDLKRLPVLTGELDILQALSQTAGVSATSEGSSSISVRGGGLDQNLVQVAGMTVLYPAHALGFYPLFHPDLIDGVTLHRGYVPSALGGRAASVVDIGWKKADASRWHMKAGSGLLSSRIALDGPIVKNKVTLLTGARISHLNYLLERQRDGNIRRSKVVFGDLSGRLSTKWNTGRLDVYGLAASDNFRFGQRFGYDYSNVNGRFSIRQNLSSKTFLRLEGSISNYLANLEQIRAVPGEYELSSGISFRQAKIEVRRQQNENLFFSVGFGIEDYKTKNRVQHPLNNSGAVAFNFSDPDLMRIIGYVSSTVDINPRVSVSGGLRVTESSTVYSYSGVRAIYTGVPAVGNIENFLSFESGDRFVLPLQFAPRFKLNINPKQDGVALSLGYSRLTQDVHQLSPTVSPTPLDIFFVSSPYLPITSSDVVSVSAGLSAERGKRPLGFNSAVFYRKTNNVNLARGGSFLRSSSTPERGFYTADGYAAGLENSIIFEGLRTSVSLGYTFSRSFVKVDRRYPEMQLQPFAKIPSPTDIPHQINLAYSYSTSGRASLSAAWVLSSGRPYTGNDGLLFQEGSFIPTFGRINGERLPPTHRLDLSFLLDNSETKRKGMRAGFGISLYNLYQRENPFAAFYEFRNTSRLEAFQFSLIGTAIPLLTINLQWD